MKRKIHFVIQIADSFKEITVWAYKYDVPVGDVIHISDLEIEYEQTQKDPIPEAYEALKKYINTHYPNKDYRTYYWTLEFV